MKPLRDRLSTPIQYVKGVGPKLSKILERKGIRTVEDAIYFLPRTYEDRRSLKKVSELEPGRKETGFGEILLSGIAFYSVRRKRVFEAVVGDGSGVITLKWFHVNERYFRDRFKKGQRLIFSGEVTWFNQQKEIHHPDVELVDEEADRDYLNFKRIVPIYSETEGLYQRTLRRLMKTILDEYAGELSSPVPEEILKRQGLIDLPESFRCVHFPEEGASMEDLERQRSKGHRRIIFDEFFFLELGMALRKKGRVLEKGIPFQTEGALSGRLLDLLPFRLTRAQERVWGEIRKDMERPLPMNRLIQGDVGSGKTVVSLLAGLNVIESGYQAAIMAPTEILAEQHFLSARRWVEPLGLAVTLLTGSVKGSVKEDLCGRIKRGDVHLVVGTHALIEEPVEFHRLGLAIIDEQHKFGVIQRSLLKKKGENPDVLVMTATPIPRTLAMTVYGDLDVSIIDEMPPGRVPVETRVFSESGRSRVYRILEEEIRKERQAFIVYPLVEESEKVDLRDATRMAEHLQSEVFPDLRVGLLHGRMKSEEKERVMAEFKGGKIQILVGHHRDRGGHRYPQRLGHGGGACGAVRPLPAPSIARPDRPRKVRVQMYSPCPVSFLRGGQDQASGHGEDERRISDRRKGPGDQGAGRVPGNTSVGTARLQGGPHSQGYADPGRGEEGGLSARPRRPGFERAPPQWPERRIKEAVAGQVGTGHGGVKAPGSFPVFRR